MDWIKCDRDEAQTVGAGDLDTVPDQRLVAEMDTVETPIVTTECVSTQLPCRGPEAGGEVGR